MEFSVLVVDDEINMCLTLCEILRSHGFNAMHTVDPTKVISILQSERIDIIILDINMPKKNGIEVLQNIKEINSSIFTVMITGFPSVDSAVIAMKYGAADYLTKPLNNKKLINILRHYVDSKPFDKVNNISPQIITNSETMKKIVEDVHHIASTDVPILITGESGTGKELIAELIHSLSTRKNESMIRVNCASIPDTLLESELFGHEVGAFTDAKKTLKGRFELASKGTLFLDEIGDMSLATQPKLLRAIQNGEISRLGSEKTIKVNPRLIAASNRDLVAMMEDGTYREDLYFRLSVVSLHLPPLRERKDDIIDLVDFFIQQFNIKYNKRIRNISNEVRALLLNHIWPGNIRELKNCIERAVLFAEGEMINVNDLATQYRHFDEEMICESMEELINSISRDKINEALEAAGGIKYKAAEILNISRRTLYNRMKSLGME